MKKKSYIGINIQFPISQQIVEGKKTIETRTYPIPENYIGQEMVLVETPGKNRKFKSRAIAIIKFGPSIKYSSKKKFYADTKRHCVDEDSKWAWNPIKGKWGWPIISLKIIHSPFEIKKRLGIKYTKDISF